MLTKFEQNCIREHQPDEKGINACGATAKDRAKVSELVEIHNKAHKSFTESRSIETWSELFETNDLLPTELQSRHPSMIGLVRGRHQVK